MTIVICIMPMLTPLLLIMGRYMKWSKCIKAFPCPLISSVDYCKNNPCANGGTCKNLSSGRKCDCKPGFLGDSCQNGKCVLDVVFFLVVFFMCFRLFCNYFVGIANYAPYDISPPNITYLPPRSVNCDVFNYNKNV